MHVCAKFQNCSLTRVGNIFERMPNFIRVTSPRPRVLSEFLFVDFGDIVYVHAFAKLALLVLEICLTK